MSWCNILKKTTGPKMANDDPAYAQDPCTVPAKAMIFAAGLGTRLQPHTNDKPKALVEVNGKPMLLHVAEKLMTAGVKHIVVNVHHHADQLRKFIETCHFPSVRFQISDETDKLLDTGGGLKKAASMLDGDQPFLVYNVDVLCDIDLKALCDHHHKQQALATLAVSNRQASRYFLWDHQRLAGWENARYNERIWVKSTPPAKFLKRAFSGIQVMSPAIFPKMTETGSFPIRDVSLRLAATHHITCFEHKPEGWLDVGTPEKLAKAQGFFI